MESAARRYNSRVSPQPGDVTLMLRRLREGESDAAHRLADLVYAELRRLAASRMQRERPDHTLSPTALANEAWLRLRDLECDIKDRQHFFAIAATAMRRLLVDYARSRRSAKRGVRADFVSEGIALPGADEKILAINEALDRLAARNARAARVVELRHFAGLTHQEIAGILSVERRTVDRDWTFAKAWLFKELGDDSLRT
jgi:RNA polymerase sigma-70 factor (ECF subfamily)